LNWKSRNKKVICFEHGWNSFFDYEINHRETLADGYMTLGGSTAESLIRHGVPKDRIIIAGNPHFNILEKQLNTEEALVPEVLYTALHWTRDMQAYNNSKLDSIIKTLSPFSNITVKTIEKSKIKIPPGVKEWSTCIYDNRNLFEETIKGLQKYDIILTPKESTFDFIALKLGKKVFRIGEEKEYRLETEPRTRNILPLTEISPEILLVETRPIVDLSKELEESLDLSVILDWAKNL